MASSRALTDECFDALTKHLVDVKFGLPWDIKQKKLGRVFVGADEKIYKFFYLQKKKRFSLRRFRPDAKRYSQNANKFLKRGIAAAKVDEHYYYPKLRCHIAVYPKLMGEKLRFLSLDDELLAKLIMLLCKLHEKGIYFRGCHLDNIILQPDGELALIDFVDVKFGFCQLSIFSRARNLHHLLTNRIDWAFFTNIGVDDFIERYLVQAKLTAPRAFLLRKFLHYKLSKGRRRR